MTFRPKLTTVAACRVAGIDRNRFNEHVAANNFTCAPPTTSGRARLFDPDDMIALRLFNDLMKDGFTPKRAGEIACEVAQAAKLSPEASTISYVESFFRGGSAHPSDSVPNSSEWDKVLFSGTDIRKVTTFRIGKLREIIAHYTEEERSIIGPDDGEPDSSDRSGLREARSLFVEGIINIEPPTE